MTYVCKELANVDNVQTCVLWVEQVTINDMFAITPANAFTIGFACVMVIITAAVFNKLGQLGDKSHD